MLPTTIEAITILNFKLFPNDFTMVGFINYPDALRTNRSLLQLGKKYRNLITGSNKRGFYLNKRGREEAEFLIKKLGVPKISGKKQKILKIDEKKQVDRGSKQARTVHPEDTIKELRNSTLFRLFKEGDFNKPPLIHLLGLLNLYENALEKEKKTRLKNIEIAAKQLKDKEVQEFIGLIREKFVDYINTN